MKHNIVHLNPFGVLVEARGDHANAIDLEIGELREIFLEHRLVILRGFSTFRSPEAFSDYCARWGELCLWPFGTVLELVEHDDPKDHIFDHSYVPLHWDGMYRPQVPEYQIFHCVSAPESGCGGRTTFTDTTLTLKNADSSKIDVWRNVTGSYSRQMEFYKSQTTSPIISHHPLRGYEVIRYNEPPKSEGTFVNPPDLEFKGLLPDDLDRFHQDLKDALYDSKNFYAHEWKDGDLVIADNFTLLHGRESFVSKSSRHLRRVQVLSNPPVHNQFLESYQ
jgi:alpha-ketoglutarate-dependent taurine dioxygenase